VIVSVDSVFGATDAGENAWLTVGGAMVTARGFGQALAEDPPAVGAVEVMTPPALTAIVAVSVPPWLSVITSMIVPAPAAVFTGTEEPVEPAGINGAGVADQA
jgi:hypothetical protein